MVVVLLMMLPAEFRICTLLVLGVLHTVVYALGWRLVFESIFEFSPPGWVVWSRALHKSTRQPEGYERTQGPPIHLLPILGGDDENGGI